MSKIEIVKQQDLKDCGACSLLCIIKYYNGYVPLEKIRDDTYTTMNGTTAFHLIEAAKKYGFDAMGVKTSNIHDENIYLPAIAHVNLKNGLQHFVVVYKIADKKIHLMDPAKGKIKMPLEEFKKIWDGILILLSPITNILQYKTDHSMTSIFLNILNHNKSLFLKIFTSNFLLMVATIISSFYFQVGISSVQNGKDNLFIKFILLLFFLFTTSKIIFEYLKNYYINYLNKNIDVSLFTTFLEHIFHLPLNFIQNRTTGEIMSRVEELDEIKNMATEIFVNLILNSILIIGAIIVLFLISKELFFSLCFIIILYLLVGLLFSKVIYRKVEKNLEYTSEFNSCLVEQIDMNYSIKNLNLVEEFLYHLERKLICMLKNSFYLNVFLNKLETCKNGIYEIGLFLINTLGMILISKGELEVLSLITFNSLILYLFNPVRELINLVPRYSYLKASFQKLKDFLCVKRESEDNIGFKNLKEGNIKVNNLTYSYNLYQNILENINFEINSGDNVLFSGPSGSGKSTICKLLYRSIATSYKGNIEFNFASEKDYNLRAIRKNILYVGQNEKLFTGTIRENILCFRDIKEKDFKKVSKICKLEEIVNKRPNRYNTLINASINNLSGGEKQRIILARALLKKANIIILDEALSEVNIELEKEILDKIFEYFERETLIYVSHKDVTDKFEKVITFAT